MTKYVELSTRLGGRIATTGGRQAVQFRTPQIPLAGRKEMRMAGSYRHIINTDGSFRGVELLDDLGDAYEALEECYAMIQFLTGGDRIKIYEAHRDGYFKKHYPHSSPFTFEEFWGE